MWASGRNVLMIQKMIMATERSEERVVVVTGVARGLGRAMALEFAEQGHRVAGCSRNNKK